MSSVTSRRKSSLLVSAALLALTMLLTTGCDAGTTASTEPPRPDNVPTEAIWTGGLDGGVYVLLSRSEGTEGSVYTGKVYAEKSGVVWYEGRFAIEPAGEPYVDLQNPESYGAWDGDTLYLRDGRALRAID